MPIKPHKGEDKAKWMARCVPEMTGTGPDKRPNEQAVAICLAIWAEHHKESAMGKPDRAAQVQAMLSRAKAVVDSGVLQRGYAQPLRKDVDRWHDVGEPEPDQSYEEFMDSCVDEVSGLSNLGDDDDPEEICQAVWDASPNAENMPSDEDSGEAAAKPALLRGYAQMPQWLIRARVNKEVDVPDPEEGQQYDDFMDTCMATLEGEDIEGEAEDLCQAAWDASDNSSDPALAEDPTLYEDAAKPELLRGYAKPRGEDDEITMEDVDPPEPGETYDEYYDRCVESDEHENACQDAWNNSPNADDPNLAAAKPAVTKEQGESTWEIGDYVQPMDDPDAAGEITDIEWRPDDDAYYCQVNGEWYHEDELEAAEVDDEGEAASVKPALLRGYAKPVLRSQPPPDPEPDEEEQVFLDRCLEEMTEDNPEMTEDEIMDECRAAWEDYEGGED